MDLYPIFHLAFLLIAVSSMILYKRNKIQLSTTIWTTVGCFFCIALVFAFESKWFFSAWHALLAIDLGYFRYRNNRKVKKELKAKMKRFERELEEYREKRNAARAATGEAN